MDDYTNEPRTRSRIGQLFDEVDRRNRLRRDIILARQRTGIYDIHTEDDLRAVLGTPVSLEATMRTAELTAAESEQEREATRRCGPSLNALFDKDFAIWRKTVGKADCGEPAAGLE